MDDIYMALVGPSGSVFIKDLEFFKSQGGFKESWGRNWIPVRGKDVEDARERACTSLPGARPFSEQAKS